MTVREDASAVVQGPLVRVVCVAFQSVFILVAWASVDLVGFAWNVQKARQYEHCPPYLVPGLSVSFHRDFERVWGDVVYGFESGAFHSYAGPGGSYFRAGLGSLVVELTYPLCASSR